MEQQLVLLPLDIMYEIRGRLPTKSLVRFRCVCKAWKDIENDPILARVWQRLRSSGEIRDPQLICLTNTNILLRRPAPAGVQFIGDVLEIDEIVSLHLDQTVTSKIWKQYIEIAIPCGYTYTNIAYCNGWHCFSIPHIDEAHNHVPILAHNPLRQETVELPRLSGQTRDGDDYVATCYGLGFDARNNLFKLTCLFFSTTTTGFYILRQKQFWEQLDQLPSRVGSSGIFHSVFLNGCLHYLVTGKHPPYEYLILAFDLEKEQFRCIDLPQPADYFDTLLDLGGHLAVFKFRDGFISIDVLKDYANKKWGDVTCTVSLYDVTNNYLGSWENKLLGRFEYSKVSDDQIEGSDSPLFQFQLPFTFREDPDCKYSHIYAFQYAAYDLQTCTTTTLAAQPRSGCSRNHRIYGHHLSIVPLNM